MQMDVLSANSWRKIPTYTSCKRLVRTQRREVGELPVPRDTAKATACTCEPSGGRSTEIGLRLNTILCTIRSRGKGTKRMEKSIDLVQGRKIFLEKIENFIVKYIRFWRKLKDSPWNYYFDLISNQLSYLSWNYESIVMIKKDFLLPIYSCPFLICK